MKVGIFTKVGKDFENGANQQALFVGQALVGQEVYYFSNEEKGKDVLSFSNPKLLEMDVVLCISLIPLELFARLKQVGIKIIWYECGHVPRVYQEDIVFGKHGYV